MPRYVASKRSKSADFRPISPETGNPAHSTELTIGQISRDAACERGGRRGPARRVLSEGRPSPASGERQTLVAAEPLGAFDRGDAPTTQCPLRPQPSRLQGLPAQRESEQLWTYHYEGAMVRYLRSWIDQLRWQRLPAFDTLAAMLVDHLEGLLNHCRTPVRFGVVEAINGNIKALLRRGRGYTNLRYLLLKAQRQAVTKTEFIAFKRAA